MSSHTNCPFQSNLLFSDGLVDGVHLDKEREPIPSTSGMQQPHATPISIDTPMRDDGFGANLEQNIICKSFVLKLVCSLKKPCYYRYFLYIYFFL